MKAFLDSAAFFFALMIFLLVFAGFILCVIETNGLAILVPVGLFVTVWSFVRIAEM